jgi:hypothetical protein
MADWHLEGTYLEACNCDAICPCRRIGGVSGGRSTYGECMGALSWRIGAGHADDVDLAGLDVVITCRYHDDEPGSPWRYILYLDEGADDAQYDALTAIFSGASGGSAMVNFPWAFKDSTLLDVCRAAISLSHEPRRGWFRVRDEVVVRVARAADQPESVSCIIPGHDSPGTEVVCDSLVLDNAAAQCEVVGRCGFETRFSYAG